MIAVAIDDWPAAVVSVAGIAFLTIVLSVALWQIFGTGKAAVAGHRDNEYRKVVDDLAAVQSRRRRSSRRRTTPWLSCARRSRSSSRRSRRSTAC